MHTAPQPFVDWRELASAADPVHPPTRARYRRLLSDLPAQGVATPVRADHGVAGSRKLHSVLSLLAIHAHQAGDEDGAATLSVGASALEAAFASQLADLGREGHAQDWLADARRRTAEVIDRWPGLDRVLLAEGRIRESLDAYVLIASTAKGHQGDDQILVPAELAAEHSLTVGNDVWVLQRRLGRAVVIELLPAAPLDEDWVDVAGTTGLESMPTSSELAQMSVDVAHKPPRRVRVG